MITALKKIYAFSGRWKGVLKKSVVFSLLHSIFDMFQIGALFLILNGLVRMAIQNFSKKPVISTVSGLVG